LAEESVTLLLNHGAETKPIGFTGESRSEFTTKPLELQNDKVEKFLEGIVFEINTDSRPELLLHMEFYIGTANRLKDSPEWFGPFSLQEADTPYWFDLDDGIECKRYMFVKLTDDPVSGIWQLTAIELLGVEDGGRME